MTMNETIERIVEAGCHAEFSPDPEVSESCGAEVSCLGCLFCSAHCGCERPVVEELENDGLDRAREITANLIAELRAERAERETRAERKTRAEVTPLGQCIAEQDWGAP